ncbi:hypothetical protein Tco_0500539 [Tanacetum coccineum]
MWRGYYQSGSLHMVKDVDFLGCPGVRGDGLFAKMVIEHRDDTGVAVFTSRARGRLFDTRGPLVRELVLEFFSTLRFVEVLLDLDAPDTIHFQRDISTAEDFLGTSPSYTLIRDWCWTLPIDDWHTLLLGRSQSTRRCPWTKRKPLLAWLPLTGAEDVPAVMRSDQGYFGHPCKALSAAITIIRIRWDLPRELTCSIPEMHQTEDWRGQHLHSSAGPIAADPLIKPGSKFSTIVHEYVTEPSRIFTLNARMGKRDDFKCVEAEEKSNLKTSL